MVGMIVHRQGHWHSEHLSELVGWRELEGFLEFLVLSKNEEEVSRWRFLSIRKRSELAYHSIPDVHATDFESDRCGLLVDFSCASPYVRVCLEG